MIFIVFGPRFIALKFWKWHYLIIVVFVVACQFLIETARNCYAINFLFYIIPPLNMLRVGRFLFKIFIVYFSSVEVLNSGRKSGVLLPGSCGRRNRAVFVISL